MYCTFLAKASECKVKPQCRKEIFHSETILCPILKPQMAVRRWCTNPLDCRNSISALRDMDDMTVHSCTLHQAPKTTRTCCHNSAANARRMRSFGGSSTGAGANACPVIASYNQM